MIPSLRTTAQRPHSAVRWPGISRAKRLLAWELWRPTAFVLAATFGVVISQKVALLGLAALMSWAVPPDAIASLAQAGGADYVYSRLVMSMLANAAPAGLALRMPYDTVIQSLLPGVYAGSSYLPPWTWVGVVFATGSSAVGALFVQTILNLVLVLLGTAGVLLAQISSAPGSRRARRARWLQVISLLAAASGAGAQLLLSWTNGSPGEMALSMVATKIFSMDSATYDAVLSHSMWVSPAINLSGLVLAVLAGTAIAAISCWVRRRRLSTLLSTSSVSAGNGWRIATPVALGTLLLLSPLQHGAAFEDQAGSIGKDLATSSEILSPGVPTGPTVVSVTRYGGGFDYEVDGAPQFIRGIGYNAITSGATEDERRARYRRDFAAIRSMDANTITGWDESEFDEILMDEAAQAGLGVIIPLNLQPGLLYSDAATRQQVLAGIDSRIERFRGSPALRIWGLGNEVVHDLVDKRMGDSAAFASFLVQAADHIHELDPDHPVIYRDAEDAYVRPVAQALRADGVDRPWFIYGMNFFTTRLEAALAKGPARTLDQPLLISEFGPAGVRGVGRAVVYSQLWKTITANRGLVLGGCAYVWTTDGPEPLDRTFGLTDANGQAVDSSLSTLADLFRKGEAAGVAAPGSLLGS